MTRALRLVVAVMLLDDDHLFYVAMPIPNPMKTAIVMSAALDDHFLHRLGVGWRRDRQGDSDSC
jgi:hypothetical protein